MISAENPSSADFFEAKYRHTGDPWNFSNSAYEQGRYDAIMAALKTRRYAHAFEPGCSVGVLTERLAGVCDAVEAIDFSPTAVARARAHCAALPQVRVHCMGLPERLPVTGFDLVVLSEIGYYFEPREWAAITAQIVAAMPAGATLLAAHWLGRSQDHRTGGDEVHGVLEANALLRLEHAERHEQFRLDRWTRR